MDGLLHFFQRLFASDFMPHGGCFFWQPGILWLHVISDSLIVLAYYSIPVILWYFTRQRPGFKLSGLILMFGGFIFACGTTHLMNIWNFWHSTYRLEGVIKAITGALSVATAIASLRLAPTATKIAMPEEMEQINAALRQEIEARKEAEQELVRLMEAQRLGSDATLRSYFEAAPQAILAVSADGRIRLVNRSTEEMFRSEEHTSE